MDSSMKVNTSSSASTSTIKSQPGCKRVANYKRPKVKVKPPTTLQKIFGNKDVVKDHYFTAGSSVNDKNQRNILKEPSPFTYPKDLEEFSYKIMTKAWRQIQTKKELKVKFNVRNNYRSRQQLDRLSRLYAKDPDVSNMRTIVDIDPQYFTVVEGRPIEKPLQIRKYIEDSREILRTKVVMGYKEDEIMLIEENIINEQRAIDEIKIQYQKYVDIFEEFLFNDHTNSMNLLRQSEEQAVIAKEKYEILKELSREFGALKASLYNLEETWRNYKIYQKFLYLVSPLEWRVKYDYFHIKNQDISLGGTENDDSSTVFGRYRLASTGDVLSLEALIDQFLDDIKTQEEPQLFFKEPVQLRKVFRFIELQNLNSLIHSEALALPLENVRTAMTRATIQFDDSISYLKEIIDNLEGGILWGEERAKSLEDLTQEMINSNFRKVVVDPEVLNLYVFIEDVFEAGVALNDAQLRVSEMMTGIENKYLQYLLQLDSLPQELVHKAESECYREEARTMKVAVMAAKKVVQIETLTHSLKKALEPRYQILQKDLKWRSPPLNPPVVKPPPPRPLTTEETEFLTFFTEFCKKSDDPKDYGIVIPKPGGDDNYDDEFDESQSESLF